MCLRRCRLHLQLSVEEPDMLLSPSLSRRNSWFHLWLTCGQDLFVDVCCYGVLVACLPEAGT